MKVLVWIDMGLAIWFALLFCTSLLKTSKGSKYEYRIWRGFNNLGWRIAYGCVAMLMIFLSINLLYEYYL
ncbi:hypothetical protein LCGC14_2842860 [marine sediment metagenome]|uniref:Uncharacterized protein n=1 Tax=marine sediment metagenome TaxID=412755 RepID=A0A0F8YXE8_9ZZZZ